MGGYRLTDPETCRLAYEQMSADGTLSKRRLEIACQMSREKTPKTAGELGKTLRTNRNNVATRLAEMTHLGVAEKVYERACTVTGKQCWTWQLTGKQPKGSVPKGESKTGLYKKERDAANVKVADLLGLCDKLTVFLKNKGHAKASIRLQKRVEEILRA